MVRCALTGTPGTGKTSISNLLDKKVIHLSDYYESSSKGKSDTGEWLIELELLNKIVQKLGSDETIFEGHTSHFLDNINLIIILRCDPQILKERLEKRNYSKEKVIENLEAEALNVIRSEAEDNIEAGKIFEWDTTKFLAEESSNIIKNFIDGKVEAKIIEK
mgnify:CR=1 FL=1